jgi:hypothetical protein
MQETPRVLTEAADVTAEVEAAVRECVDWFTDGPMSVEDFIDRLCDDYGIGWELEKYDCPAARKIMRIARVEKRERAS